MGKQQETASLRVTFQFLWRTTWGRILEHYKSRHGPQPYLDNVRHGRGSIYPKQSPWFRGRWRDKAHIEGSNTANAVWAPDHTERLQTVFSTQVPLMATEKVLVQHHSPLQGLLCSHTCRGDSSKAILQLPQVLNSSFRTGKECQGKRSWEPQTESNLSTL